MERVMKRISDNTIIILFIVVVLSSTFYMGLSERKLASVSSTNSISQSI